MSGLSLIEKKEPPSAVKKEGRTRRPQAKKVPRVKAEECAGKKRKTERFAEGGSEPFSAARRKRGRSFPARQSWLIVRRESERVYLHLTGKKRGTGRGD